MVEGSSKLYRATWTRDAAECLRHVEERTRAQIIRSVGTMRESYGALGTMLPEGAVYDVHVLRDTPTIRTGYLVVAVHYVVSFIVNKREKLITLLDVIDQRSSEVDEFPA